MARTFNIGAAAQATGVHSKMIRHYESIGLLPKVTRTAAGYRVYNERDLHTLRFIRRARDLGFSMKEIKALLGLWKNKSRASSEVKRLANQHIDELEKKIAELRSMASALRSLAANCQGDDRPDCPILKGLERL